jgi:hypothetical protein
MSIGPVRNPLHRLIDVLTCYEAAFLRVHQAENSEARRQAINGWSECHPLVWNGRAGRDDAVRGLADPAKAWLVERKSTYVDRGDFDLVETCAFEVSAFAVSAFPMSMPDMYSDWGTTREELYQQWNRQGQSYFALRGLISRLKELAARAGQTWASLPAADRSKESGRPMETERAESGWEGPLEYHGDRSRQAAGQTQRSERTDPDPDALRCVKTPSILTVIDDLLAFADANEMWTLDANQQREVYALDTQLGTLSEAIGLKLPSPHLQVRENCSNLPNCKLPYEVLLHEWSNPPRTSHVPPGRVHMLLCPALTWVQDMQGLRATAEHLLANAGTGSRADRGEQGAERHEGRGANAEPEKQDKPKRGGGSPLSKRNPLQFNVYQRILSVLQECNDDQDEALKRLNDEKDFVELVKNAKITLRRRLVAHPSKSLMRAALDWKRRPRKPTNDKLR